MPNDNDIKAVVLEKSDDLMTPGFVAEFSPVEADMMGAFFEDALSEDDAMEASYD